MATSDKFWNKVAYKYSKQPIADEGAYQRKLDITQSYFNPDMEVLEFGCGTGGTALIHAPHVKHIRAIDISSRMIEIAQGKADAQAVDNVTFEVNTIEALEAPDGKYDAVLGLSILHLLEDKEAALAKVYRMLKPGGIFVSSTVVIREMNPILPLVLPLMRLIGQAPLVRSFNKDQLKQSIIDAGFTIDHEWQPGKGKAVFLVAKKPAAAADST